MEGAPRDLVYQGCSMARGQGETPGVTGCEGAGKWDEKGERVDGGASQGEVGARCQRTDGTCTFGKLAGDGGVGEGREGGSEGAESSGSEGEEDAAMSEQGSNLGRSCWYVSRRVMLAIQLILAMTADIMRVPAEAIRLACSTNT